MSPRQLACCFIVLIVANICWSSPTGQNGRRPAPRDPKSAITQRVPVTTTEAEEAEEASGGEEEEEDAETSVAPIQSTARVPLAKTSGASNAFFAQSTASAVTQSDGTTAPSASTAAPTATNTIAFLARDKAATDADADDSDDAASTAAATGAKGKKGATTAVAAGTTAGGDDSDDAATTAASGASTAGAAGSTGGGDDSDSDSGTTPAAATKVGAAKGKKGATTAAAPCDDCDSVNAANGTPSVAKNATGAAASTDDTTDAGPSSGVTTPSVGNAGGDGVPTGKPGVLSSATNQQGGDGSVTASSGGSGKGGGALQPLTREVDHTGQCPDTPVDGASPKCQWKDQDGLQLYYWNPTNLKLDTSICTAQTKSIDQCKAFCESNPKCLAVHYCPTCVDFTCHLLKSKAGQKGLSLEHVMSYVHYHEKTTCA